MLPQAGTDRLGLGQERRSRNPRSYLCSRLAGSRTAGARAAAPGRPRRSAAPQRLGRCPRPAAAAAAAAAAAPPSHRRRRGRGGSGAEAVGRGSAAARAAGLPFGRCDLQVGRPMPRFIGATSSSRRLLRMQKYVYKRLLLSTEPPRTLGGRAQLQTFDSDSASPLHSSFRLRLIARAGCLGAGDQRPCSRRGAAASHAAAGAPPRPALRRRRRGRGAGADADAHRVWRGVQPLLRLAEHRGGVQPPEGRRARPHHAVRGGGRGELGASPVQGSWGRPGPVPRRCPPCRPCPALPFTAGC